MTENKALMAKARESLSGNWLVSILAVVVFNLVVGLPQIIPFAGSLIAIFITGFMMIGLYTFSLLIARNEKAEVEVVFSGRDRVVIGFLAYFFQGVFVFLWSLLLIIPGVIAAYSYSMTFFILADDHSISAMDAIKKSKEMTYGYKLKLFFLGWRFLGWSLLCVLTLGVGFLWLGPYCLVTLANFYDDIKDSPIVEES